MTSRAKSTFNIFFISSICASIGIIAGSFKSTTIYAKEQIITPIVDARIDAKTKYMCNKLDVIYKYNMAIASRDKATSKIWDDCVDEVYAQSNQVINKLGK
jgi:hypothetical protein